MTVYRTYWCNCCGACSLCHGVSLYETPCECGEGCHDRPPWWSIRDGETKQRVTSLVYPDYQSAAAAIYLYIVRARQGKRADLPLEKVLDYEPYQLDDEDA